MSLLKFEHQVPLKYVYQPLDIHHESLDFVHLIEQHCLSQFCSFHLFMASPSHPGSAPLI